MSTWLAYENQRRLDALVDLYGKPKDYVQAGIDAPKIKQKALTGIYKKDDGVEIAHGLEIEKILGVEVLLRQLDETGKVIAVYPAGREGYTFWVTATQIELSGGLGFHHDNEVSVLITYEA